MEGLPAQLDARLAARAQRAAAWVRDRAARGDTVLVVHHIDADGVTAGAIAATALDRAGVAFRTLAVKSMDQVHQDLIRRSLDDSPDDSPDVQQSGKSVPSGKSALWFCDLGSTVYMQFPDHERLVCDHHQLVRDGSEEDFPHVNPLLDDLSGEELSGAGCAYLVAAALDDRNLDLLPLALMGATADLQDRKAGCLHGANATLVALGQATGLVATRRDLAFFGPATRPLRKFLARGEPAVPTVTGSQRSAEAFLLHLGIPLVDSAGTERTWFDLDDGEQQRLRSALASRLLDVGLPERVPALWRTVITFPREAAGPLREAQESGTLLNGTARYGRPEIGLAVARGDRDAAYREALDLLLNHRKHLASALDAFAQRGVVELHAIQHIHLQDAVLDTVVGIVCGMALDGLGLRRDLALLAFAWTPDGRTKVSSRSPSELQSQGIDLATALREAAASLGGQGGGHKGAAGATIPRGCEAAFATAVDALVARQLGRVPVPAPLLVRPGHPQARLF